MKFIFTAFLLATSAAFAQINITPGYNFNSSVLPEQMFWVTVVNSYGEDNAILEAEIKNSSGHILLAVHSQAVRINMGVNNFIGKSTLIKSTIYGTGAQAEYLKSTGLLPSGLFSYCVRIKSVKSVEYFDEYCDEFTSSTNPFLFLLSPLDGDTIEMELPLLNWTHGEPFSVLASNEFFRIQVAEIKEGQTAESAITINPPIYYKNRLTSHFVQYPQDGGQLKKGNSYAWQVQRISQNNIVVQTDVWKFTLKPDPLPDKDLKYIILKKNGSNDIIPVYEKLHFRFDEAYNGSSVICNLYDEKNNLLKPEITDDSEEGNSKTATKQAGFNVYEFDLRKFGLKKGYYTVEIFNEKREKYKINIKKL